MPRWGWLVVAAVAGLVVAYLFAFTLPGLVGEGVAALALLALIIKGILAIAGRSLTHREH
jgi:hypothetical protein